MMDQKCKEVNPHSRELTKVKKVKSGGKIKKLEGSIINQNDKRLKEMKAKRRKTKNQGCYGHAPY